MLKAFRSAVVARCLALAALLVAAGTLWACGGSGDGGSVARVGDAKITKTEFDHWLRVNAMGSTGDPDAGGVAQGPALPGVVPRPPDFKECIAAREAAALKLTPGQGKPPPAQSKAQCRKQYTELHDQVLQFLISARWTEGEAAQRGIKVSDAEVRARFAKTKKQSFPKQQYFESYLKKTGLTLDDVLYRIRQELLSTKLRAAVTKGSGDVTDAQVAAYYNANIARFSQPERRDARLVLTKTRPGAQRALAALKAGQSWKTVARKYSIDSGSKDQGGVMLAIAKGQRDPALDEALFAAAKGRLSGPVKTDFGYYVFSVQKITPATNQTLDQARVRIRTLLAGQNQQKALSAFLTRFRTKWQARTVCSAGYVMQNCKDGPTPP